MAVEADLHASRRAVLQCRLTLRR